MTPKAYVCTAADLAAAGVEQIPAAFITAEHLIYNSPAALAFNSPGAEGFGVKRAGLAIPGSVMLLVGPGCCGRNTTILSEMSGYSERFFFYIMDETDIVTGRHLTKLPQAVGEICASLEARPSVVMICLTCVDALLGTDMERVCRKAAAAVGLPVVPCYMYALTREGRKPPMVAVRQAVYSLLEERPKEADHVNILGYFSPLIDSCEIYPLLRRAGVKKIQEISRCKTFEEYQEMGAANFNLVLHEESRLAARDLQERLHMPGVELTRLYDIEKIRRQYAIFANALGMTFDDGAYFEEAKEAVGLFTAMHGDTVFAVGEMANADPFELSVALCRYGLRVAEIYGTVTPERFVYIRQLVRLSPETKIMSNLSPSMLYYEPDAAVTATIGKDAAYYHPDAARVLWTEERQPFGYAGVTKLFRSLQKVMEKGKGE